MDNKDKSGEIATGGETENTDNIEDVSLDVLPKDGERVLKELEAGNMVIARSKSDFLYIVEFDEQFHMFTHVPGAPGGGQRQFPKDEKYIATVRNLANISDSVYVAEFDKRLNLYGVMSTAEDGILSMFPGEDRDNDGVVDFGLSESSETPDE